jgi:pyruvate dehydrogenase E2 component (dihydrolipoamide acetyltransferase)
MATPVIMPKIGQSVETCILTEWFKKKGDLVKKGEVLFSFETDKASMEEEAKNDGVLLDIFRGPGEEVPVLTNIAVIGQTGEDVDVYRPGTSEPLVQTTDGESISDTGTQSEIVEKDSSSFRRPSSRRIKISPRAKVFAGLNNIDYSAMQGTGPGGRIMMKDIETYARFQRSAVNQDNPDRATASDLPDSSGYVERKLSNVRRLISTAMQNSLKNSAQLTHHLSADARKLLDTRKSVKDLRKSPDITINDMICYSVVNSLKEHPEMNAHFLQDRIREFRIINLAIAVDTPRGLMVPVLMNAGGLSIEELSVGLKSIAGQCRQGSINPDLLAPETASFTVSNLGAYGIEMFTPILNVPQVGILGVNTITLRPADIGNGIIGMVPYIGLSLTYDHRAVDGGPASRFLQTVKNQIEFFASDLI